MADAQGAGYVDDVRLGRPVAAGGGPNVKVPPFEGVYETEAGLGLFDAAARERLVWTLVLRLPEPIEGALLEDARTDAAKKRQLPALDRVRGERVPALRCCTSARTRPSRRRSRSCTSSSGRTASDRPAGRHHELYLGDPRRAKPERLRTILRQPVA